MIDVKLPEFQIGLFKVIWTMVSSQENILIRINRKSEVYVEDVLGLTTQPSEFAADHSRSVFSDSLLGRLLLQKSPNRSVPHLIGLKDNSVMIDPIHVHSPGIGDFTDHPFNNFFREQYIILTQKAFRRPQD